MRGRNQVEQASGTIPSRLKTKPMRACSDASRISAARVMVAPIPTAAPLIAALREKAPDLRIFAWGGPKMEAAGAEMMGQTCDDGAMGLGGFAAALAVHKKIREITQKILSKKMKLVKSKSRRKIRLSLTIMK